VDTQPVEASEATAPEGGRRRRPLWFRLLQGAALVAVAGLLGLLGWRLVAKNRGAELVGAIGAGKAPPAPAFDLGVIWTRAETWPPPLRGALADGRIALRELRGYPVVINFWASWCIPCKKEATILAASARAHSGEVAFLGIDVQDLTSDARRFLRRYGANYVSVREGGNSVYSAYGLTGVPETYYLDRRGRIVAHSLGQLSRDELEEGIAQALAGAERRRGKGRS